MVSRGDGGVKGLCDVEAPWSEDVVSFAVAGSTVHLQNRSPW